MQTVSQSPLRVCQYKTLTAAKKIAVSVPNTANLFFTAVSIFFISFILTLMAGSVSYTHLDVYKRQVLSLAGGVLLGGAALLFSDAFLRFFGADGTTLQFTKDYLLVLALSLIHI